MLVTELTMFTLGIIMFIVGTIGDPNENNWANIVYIIGLVFIAVFAVLFLYIAISFFIRGNKYYKEKLDHIDMINDSIEDNKNNGGKGLLGLQNNQQPQQPQQPGMMQPGARQNLTPAQMQQMRMQQQRMQQQRMQQPGMQQPGMQQPVNTQDKK